jgi:hypothetical protein
MKNFVTLVFLALLLTGCRDGRLTIFDSSDNSTDSHDTTIVTNAASTNAAALFSGTTVVPQRRDRSILKMEGSK